MKVFRWDWTGQQPGLFEVTSSSGLSINQGRLLMSTTTSGSSHIGSYSERIASLIFIAIIAPRVFAGLVRAGFASSITALKRDPCIKIGRGKYYAQAFPKSLIASPSFHGGRGALPSAGGHPADLTFLAGGGHRYPHFEKSNFSCLWKDIAHNNRLLRYETDQLTEHQLCSHELCSQGIKVPIYCFGTQSLMDNCPFGGFSQTSEEEQSLLDSLLLARWEDRMWRGHFKYDITTTEIKVICGEKKFLAQLNGAWSMNCTGEAGDCKMTNQGYLSVIDWMKQYEELLFCISSGEKAYSELIFSAAVPNYSLWIIITVNPIEYGHVFLVPHGFNSLYQVLDARTLEMVARVAVETNNSSFRIFYDFSGPNASNIYFQACYLPGILPVESLPVDTLFADRQGEICISTVRDYPIKTLLFESRTNFKMMLEVVAEICSSLLDKVIPYNMLISDCGKKIFLFLQCPRLQALSNSCNLSAWECGGYFLFSSRQEFDQVMEEDLLELLNSVSLDNEGFAAVKQLCCNIPNGLVI